MWLITNNCHCHLVMRCEGFIFTRNNQNSSNNQDDIIQLYFLPCRNFNNSKVKNTSSCNAIKTSMNGGWYVHFDWCLYSYGLYISNSTNPRKDRIIYKSTRSKESSLDSPSSSSRFSTVPFFSKSRTHLFLMRPALQTHETFANKSFRNNWVTNWVAIWN